MKAAFLTTTSNRFQWKWSIAVREAKALLTLSTVQKEIKERASRGGERNTKPDEEIKYRESGEISGAVK